MPETSLDALRDLMGEVVDLSDADFREGAVLGEDIPIDSKDMLRVITRIESRYRLRIPPRDLLRLRTIGDLLNLLPRR